jgi:hypothetical protein
MRPVANSRPDAVFSFLRAREADRVFVALNFSPLTQRVRFSGADHPGTYRDAFDGTAQTLAPSTELELPPWGHRVLTAG